MSSAPSLFVSPAGSDPLRAPVVNRLESLDWLRGLLALSIMLYHLTGWKLHEPDSGELLGRLGIYGVSMFFVLSGLSMAAGYHSYVCDARSAVRFFIRRLFRIWPLLWLAVALVSASDIFLKGRDLDWVLIFLNLTTLFGFVSPGAYINTGAWSIGNEMVYYALTPFFIGAYRCGLRWGNWAVIATLPLGLYFGLVALSPTANLASQWQTYIHPLNNLCFYAAGLALYYNFHAITFKTGTQLAVLLVALALFAATPVHADLIHTVTGIERVIFFFASTLLVLAFYKSVARPSQWIARPLALLGAATYGVYLLHPVVFRAVEIGTHKMAWPIAPAVSMIATMVLTIAVALLIYRYFETPFIHLGKRLTGTATSPMGQLASPASSGTA